MRTLGPFLSATAQLHPKVNIKQIVIALIDRLAAYAAREAENDSPEEIKRQEEEGAKRLAKQIEEQRKRMHDANMAAENAGADGSSPQLEGEAEERAAFAGSPADPPTATAANGVHEATSSEPATPADANAAEPSAAAGDAAVAEEPKIRKFRGIPEDVKLFEVFWHQVVALVKVRFLL